MLHMKIDLFRAFSIVIAHFRSTVLFFLNKNFIGWLTSTGYGSFVQKFVDEMIDGETLLTLSSADLSNLGFKKIGERNKVLARLTKLKAANRAASSHSRTESSSSVSQSDDGGDHVKITATLKKKTAELEVSQVINLV